MRALDFGSSGRKKGRKVWPRDGGGSRASPRTNSNPISGTVVPQDQTTPTWADRVRGGIARGIPSGSSRPNPSGNGGTTKPSQVAPFTSEVVREKKSSSLDDSDIVGVDHALQSDCVFENKERDGTESKQALEGEDKGEEQSGCEWETVTNSRNQSRNNSASAPCPEASAVTDNSASSSGNEEYMVNGGVCKDKPPLSSSGEDSPCHDVTFDSSSSPRSQVDVTSHSDDLSSLPNADAIDHGLDIEDLARGGAVQLLVDDEGEQESEVELSNKSVEVVGTSTLSQGLSQTSDKVHVRTYTQVEMCTQSLK